MLGIGNSWNRPGGPLVSIDPPNCVYTGAKGVEVYQELSGCAGAQPPVQCAGGHWSEACFGVEVLTPTREAPSKVSALTLAALEDIGYVVDYFGVEFTASDLDPSCRCNSNRAFSSWLRLWDDPGIRRSEGPSSKSLDDARAYGYRSVKSVRVAGGEFHATVLFMEGGRFYEVTV
jgi:hypothetical protein